MKMVKREGWRPAWSRMGDAVPGTAPKHLPTPMQQIIGSETGKSIGQVVDFAAYYGSAFLAGWGSFVVIQPDSVNPARRKQAPVTGALVGGVAAAGLWWLFTGNPYGTGAVLAGTAFAWGMAKL